MNTKKIAFVFPGQGSQTVGMLKKYADAFPKIKNEIFALAQKRLDYDLWELIQNGTLEKDGVRRDLNVTEYAQPALLAVEVMLWRIWCATRTELPILLAGHSLGEYSALVCAGVLDLGDALQLVATRGKLMQQVQDGAMAAVLGLKDDEVIRLCAELPGVYPANFNAPGQVVISGLASAINAEAIVEQAKKINPEAKVKVRMLNVSIPSHCELMRPAATELRREMDKINFATPQIEVIHNVAVKSYSTAAEIKDALTLQMYSPVRWTESIRLLAADRGVEQIYECGPGKVLAGLIKRIVPEKGDDFCKVLDSDEMLGTLGSVINSLQRG